MGTAVCGLAVIAVALVGAGCAAVSTSIRVCPSHVHTTLQPYGLGSAACGRAVEPVRG